jgi:hypothetical protein
LGRLFQGHGIQLNTQCGAVAANPQFGCGFVAARKTIFLAESPKTGEYIK